MANHVNDPAFKSEFGQVVHYKCIWKAVIFIENTLTNEERLCLPVRKPLSQQFVQFFSTCGNLFFSSKEAFSI